MASEAEVRNAKLKIEEEAKAIYAANQQGQGAPVFDEMGNSLIPAKITWEEALAQSKANNPEAVKTSQETVDVLSTWEPIGDMTLEEQARELSKTKGFKADLAELRLNPKQWKESLRSIDKITNPENLGFYWDAQTNELVKVQLPDRDDDEIILRRLQKQGLTKLDPDNPGKLISLIDKTDPRYKAALEGAYVGDVQHVHDPNNNRNVMYTWDGTDWQVKSVAGTEVNTDPFAVMTPQGVSAAMYDRLAPKIKGQDAELKKFPQPEGKGGTKLPDTPEGGPPSPPTQGRWNPNLTRDPNAGAQYMDSWRNRGNIPSSQFTGTGRATQVGPWDPAGLFDPATATTPYDYATLLRDANMQNIASPFQQPFQDYLDRAQLSYGLMDPVRAGEQGAGGFAQYISGQPQLAGTEDLWGQVQNIMGGFSDLDPRAQDQLASAFGIGLTDEAGRDIGRDQREMLARQLQSYDVNPLLRRAQAGRLARDYARASLGNEMYRQNPLAWALENRTGYVAPQLQQAGFGRALAGPQFDAAGNIVPKQTAQGTSEYNPFPWDIGGVG